MIHRIYRIWEKSALAVSRTSIRENPSAQAPLHPSSFGLQPSQRASSLITTLLVLVVLSTIVVAFMQSMSVERSVARSSVNRLRAEQAAQAGVDAGIAVIANALPRNGANLTNGFAVWTWCSNSAFTVPYTGILTNSMDVSGTNAGVTNTVWLFACSNLPAAPDRITPVITNTVDFNAAKRINSSTDSIRADWIAYSTNVNGEVVRYSFWVEDDAGRLPVNVVGNPANVTTNTGFLRDLAIPTNGSVGGGLPASQILALTSSPDRTSQLLGARSYLQIAADASNSPSSFTTRTRNAGNRINYGPCALQSRTNINLMFSNNPSIASFVTNFDSYVRQALPAYTVRKDPGSTGSLKRIAAALFDYLDTNSDVSLSPTLVQALSTNMTSDWPSAPSSANAYYGVEAVPRINEYVAYYGGAADAPSIYSTSQVTVTRIIELWNMSQKQVTLSNISVRLFAQQRYIPFGLPSVPLADETITNFTPASITLAPNGFGLLRYTQTFSSTLPADFNGFRSGLTFANSGIVLFGSINGGPVGVVDGFSPLQLQNNPAGGRAGTSPGYGGSGDTTDTRASLGRTLNRWATVTGTAHSLGGPNNSASNRTYQNMLTWFDAPQVGGAQSVSPLSPPSFIKDGPMDYVGEFGNIFDLSNDLTDGTTARGGKTLVVGQFDPYFRIQNGVDSTSFADYSSYIRRADSALLDIFSVNNDLRVNINSPRPPSEPLRPFAILSNSVEMSTSQIFPQAAKPTFSSAELEKAIISRLATPNWRDARPFRNMNDLTTLGSDVSNPASGPLLAGTNFWSSAQSRLWKANAPTSTAVSILTGPTPGSAPSVVSGDDRSREEALRRIANFVDVTSLTFRVFGAGQVISPQGRQTAKSLIEVVVTFEPNLTIAGDGTTASVTYSPSIKTITGK